MLWSVKRKAKGASRAPEGGKESEQTEVMLHLRPEPLAGSQTLRVSSSRGQGKKKKVSPQ